MSTNNLAVRITADIVDLQTKFSVAKAELSGLTAEMNRLARSSAAGALDAGGAARMQQVAGDMLRARSAAAGYASELTAAGQTVGSFSRQIGQAGEHSATAVRYVRELFDEISSGRTRYLPSTLAALGQSALHMNLAMLASVGAAGALAGGLAYLAYRAVETENALHNVKLGADFAGNFDLPTASIRHFADVMSSASNITSSDAIKIAGILARIPGMTDQAFGVSARIISQWAEESGQSADKAAGAFAKILAPTMTATAAAQELSKASLNIRQADIDAAHAADRSGNANAVLADKLKMMTSVLKATSGDWERYQAAAKATATVTTTNMSVANAFVSQGDVQAKMLRRETDEYNRQAAAVRGLITAQAALPPSPEQVLKTGVSVATKENPIALQVQTASGKIAQMTAALAVAHREGDKVNVNLLTESLAKARENLQNLQFGPVMERMRTQMAQVAASWDGTQTGLLEKQRSIATQALAQTQAGSKEYLSIQQEVARLDVQIHRQAGEEIIANARERISELDANSSLGATQRLAEERDVWQQVLAGSRLNAAQRIEVERSLNQSIAALHRQEASQQRSIAMEDLQANISIARMKVEAEKNALDLSAAADQATTARKLALAREYTAQMFALNLQQLDAELAEVRNEPVEYERVYNRIRELKAKLVLDMQALDRQAAAGAARGVHQQVSQWRSAVGEIESAEGGMIANLLTGRQTLANGLLQIGSNLVTREIENDARALTTRLLLARNEQTEEKALEQGGFLYHMLFEGQKTAASVAGETARTGATIIGTTTRTALEEAAAAKTLAIKILTAGKTIAIDAAEAAAGAFKALAGIPVVGPVLAAAAGAAIFMEVKNLASFDVGAWNVPQDMPAIVHAGETILPRPFAEDFRSAISGRGTSRAADGEEGGDVHVHLHGHSAGGLFTANIDDLVAAIKRAHRRGAFS